MYVITCWASRFNVRRGEQATIMGMLKEFLLIWARKEHLPDIQEALSSGEHRVEQNELNQHKHDVSYVASH